MRTKYFHESYPIDQSKVDKIHKFFKERLNIGENQQKENIYIPKKEKK